MVNMSELKPDEILSLLNLQKSNLIVRDYGKNDDVIMSLEKQGYISGKGINYCLTEEGKKKTQGFVDKYNKIVKDMVAQYGASNETHLRIQEATGLHGKVIEWIAGAQGIILLP